MDIYTYLVIRWSGLVKDGAHRARRALARLLPRLRSLRDTVCSPHRWEFPGKQETSLEWLREIHGTRDWCVKAAQ